MTHIADPTTADLWLIRHAPSVDHGAMAGRRDVDADCSDLLALAAVRSKVALRQNDGFIVSPAKRCQQTAAALWPEVHVQQARLEPRLWEQNFGLWEGMAYADLPDLGQMNSAELSQFVPPQGESFAQLCQRVWPVLRGFGPGRQVIVAHAGVIRAALALALGAPPLGMGFSIAPLSATRISCDLSSGAWAIHCVNWTAQ